MHLPTGTIRKRDINRNIFHVNNGRESTVNRELGGSIYSG
jgi:hypothetical protein